MIARTLTKPPVFREKQLLICDIDGVVLCPKKRDHLMPEKHLADRNEHWHTHQSAINSRPDPILDHGADLVRAIGQFNAVLFMTSRLEIARLGTERDLAMAGFLYPEVSMRQMDDHRPPAEMKLAKIYAVINTREPERVLFIDDDRDTVDAVNAAEFEIPVRAIHFKG